MQLELDVYIIQDCPGFDRANRIARLVEKMLPAVVVNVIDLDQLRIPPPENVFAVPTYILNGKAISLGNPDENALIAQLQAAFELC